jgi:UDP-MurNAc hydroxylase
METKITFLSHASFLVESNGKKLLFDPWLIGTCYWKSWWNYPEVNKELLNELNPDAIYITHVHWDHWHGPSLKKLFNKKIEIITHREPNDRSVNDLRKIGFQNITLLNHSETYELGGIKITPYQFGVFLNDSAVVVETENIKLLNANDCKIAGLALRQIISKHKKFDFALRSHSSANDRICYSIKNENSILIDDNEHYSRSFKYFMDAVKPKYAIPFASNHCHLHKEVFHLNDYVTDPIILEKNIKKLGGLKYSELQIMLSGDSWSSESGFSQDLTTREIFNNKNDYLISYRDKYSNSLNKFYQKEENIKMNPIIINKFSEQISYIPKLLRSRLGNWSYALNVSSENKDNNKYYKVIPKNASIEEITFDEYNFHPSRIRIPIKIFLDSVMLNMFHHGSISKRNKYEFDTIEDFNKYNLFQDLLEYVELQVFPLNFRYIFKLFGKYILRWREVLVYFTAVRIKLFYKKPMFLIEEDILKNT